VGYAAALINDSSNASTLGLKILAVLFACEVLAVAAWRAVVLWRRHGCERAAAAVDTVS
jgi:hypothetical protein